eukprot:gb/GECG01016679.1/.p1 GENE.gb/GECG01016679.1/~~gb/GECG01016679.1/.p1  ORF type:complete len:224 (+),score=41.09 gb/GECG01016679.1/:1-672(+)
MEEEEERHRLTIARQTCSMSPLMSHFYSLRALHTRGSQSIKRISCDHCGQILIPGENAEKSTIKRRKHRDSRHKGQKKQRALHAMRVKCSTCGNRSHKVLPWRHQKHPLAYKQVQDTLARKQQELERQQRQQEAAQKEIDKIAGAKRGRSDKEKDNTEIDLTQMTGISNGSKRVGTAAQTKKKKKKRANVTGASMAAQQKLQEQQQQQTSSVLGLAAALRGNR